MAIAQSSEMEHKWTTVGCAKPFKLVRGLTIPYSMLQKQNIVTNSFSRRPGKYKQSIGQQVAECFNFKPKPFSRTFAMFVYDLCWVFKI
jgi:hypothetical protein